MSFSNVLRWHIPKTVQDGLILEEMGSRTKTAISKTCILPTFFMDHIQTSQEYTRPWRIQVPKLTFTVTVQGQS